MADTGSAVGKLKVLYAILKSHSAWLPDESDLEPNLKSTRRA